MTYIKTTQITLVPFDVKIIPGNKLAVAFLALFCQVLCSPTFFVGKQCQKGLSSVKFSFGWNVMTGIWCLPK